MSKLLIVTGSTSSGKTTHARDWAWRHEAIVRDEFTPIGVVVDLLRRGRADFYIYRIAVVNPQGRMVDLNWDAVKEFAITSGLKHVPELWRGGHDEFDPDAWIDYSFAEDAKQLVNFGYVNQPIALSDPKTVDEGVVVRYDVSYVPYLLKAKSPIFLGWETAELDKGIIDIESEES